MFYNLKTKSSVFSIFALNILYFPSLDAMSQQLYKTRCRQLCTFTVATFVAHFYNTEKITFGQKWTFPEVMGCILSSKLNGSFLLSAPEICSPCSAIHWTRVRCCCCRRCDKSVEQDSPNVYALLVLDSIVKPKWDVLSWRTGSLSPFWLSDQA